MKIRTMVLTWLSLSLLAVSLLPPAMASDTVQTTLTHPVICKEGCETLGATTFGFGSETTLENGDRLYVDLPPGVSVCSPVDLEISGGNGTPVLFPGMSVFPVGPFSLTAVSPGAGSQLGGVGSGVYMRVSATPGTRRVEISIHAPAADSYVSVPYGARLDLAILDQIVHAGYLWKKDSGGIYQAPISHSDNRLVANAKNTSGHILFALHAVFSSKDSKFAFSGERDIAHVYPEPGCRFAHSGPPAYDATGDWGIQEDNTWSNCSGLSPPGGVFDASITQTGGSFTLGEGKEEGTIVGTRYLITQMYDGDPAPEVVTIVWEMVTSDLGRGYLTGTQWDGEALCNWGGDIFLMRADRDCVPSTTQMCLRNSRFSVSVNWRNVHGQTGVGRMVPATDDSGLFWFFSESNMELLVKVLNGCGINDRYWVFYAATTDQEFEITVTDTQTGEVATYTNPLGSAADAITDTNAFATCP